jgi:hypothetical protein
MIKRLFNMAIAVVLDILCLPLALLIACAAWLESGSPIIYPSLRIGQFGNPFFYVLNHSFSLDIRLMWKTEYVWAKMGHLKGKMRSNEK